MATTLQGQGQLERSEGEIETENMALNDDDLSSAEGKEDELLGRL